ncbi:MAG: glycosyltransferase family 1 protein [Burkholderiales bacterium]|nr:MAG: glycosyltransferase family 1 protein [Burkholderiales bacterium]
MTKPTILVDGHVLDGKPQGTCAYIAGLYGEIARQGCARVLMATAREESLARWFPDASAVEWVPLRSSNKFARLGMEFDQLTARWRPDFAHFQYVTPFRKRSKWIVTVHDLLFLDAPQYFPWRYRMQNHALFRMSSLRADVVLTVSEYSRDAICRHFGIDRSRIHVTYNAPDRFFRAEDMMIDGLSSGRFIVYVSRFEPRKNQHALVQAFRDLAAELPEYFRLVLVGYPALAYPALDEALRQGGNRVTVLTNLSHAQLTWLYRHAAASIYPSNAEGFGMPVIEAVAAGGISYCADNTAMHELVPYVHGSFDGSNPSELRDTIRRAAAGSDTGARVETQARMKRTFSWASSGEALMKALHA